jgi:hypothetical protein
MVEEGEVLLSPLPIREEVGDDVVERVIER